MEVSLAREEQTWLEPAGVKPPVGPPRVAVLGLARSGIGAARLLLSRRCRVDLLDLRLPEESAESSRELAARGASLRLGPHDPAWLSGYDLVVKSPGIPGSIPFLAEARRRSVPVIGELELAWLAARGPVLAITGTNGKSTTTAWAGDCFRVAGRAVQVVGNIGRAFSEGVLEAEDATFVCEVSSFQLEDIVSFRPRVACLLNLTPDHIDRHGTLEAYREAGGRWARFGLQDLGEDGGFVQDEALWLRRDGREARLIGRTALSLPGPHNLENALAAAASAAFLGVDAEPIARSLATFPGLPHRLEPVRDKPSNG